MSQASRQSGGRTQKARILAALERAGARGVDRTAFLGPETADFLPPVLQFAARIGELRADGHNIEAHGRRNRCVVYRLVAEPAQEPVPAAPNRSGSDAEAADVLFETAPASRSAFDPWDGDRP